MGGQFRENWKRLANKILPKNVPTANEDKDIVRVEDLNGFPALNPVAGDLIIGSGTQWIKLPIGANGLVLKASGGSPQWLPDVSATGFVTGPSSAINNSVARFDGTTGSLIKDGVQFLVDDSGNASIAGNTLISGDLTVLGNTNIGGTTIISGSVIIVSGLTVISGITNLATTIISGNLTIISGTIVNSIASGTGITVTITNSFFNAISSGTNTVLMPSGAALGQTFIVKDIAGVAGAANITVSGNGNTIDGQPSTSLINNYQSVTLILGPTEWNII